VILNKETKYFEIECDLKFITHRYPTPPDMEIIPKECPTGKGVCKKTNDSTCENYVRMQEAEMGFSNTVLCRGSQALKFIMED